MRTVRRVGPALAVVLLLLAGCSTRGDLQRMEETIIAEFREVNQRQDSLAQEIRSLRRAVLDSLAVREGEALTVRGELGRRLEALQQELGRVTALAGENQRLLVRLQQRLASRPAGGGETATGEDTATASAGGDTAATGDGGGEGPSATALYEASLQQFRRGSYGTARAGLEEFLSRFPDHELSPDAQFYVAETYARADELERALDEYGRVVELFPDSRRAPAALYKSGRIELERGNVEDARVFFSRVVSGYPESDEATLARDQLDELGGGG